MGLSKISSTVLVQLCVLGGTSLYVYPLKHFKNFVSWESGHKGPYGHLRLGRFKFLFQHISVACYVFILRLFSLIGDIFYNALIPGGELPGLQPEGDPHASPTHWQFYGCSELHSEAR